MDEEFQILSKSTKSPTEKISVSSELNAALACHNFLANLGDFYRLKFKIDLKQLEADLTPFENSWMPYNSLKPQISREGLSLTSLDGNLSGRPDLESLLEINRRDGSNFQELDFNKPTKVYRNSKSLQELLNHFAPVGRSHLLRLNCGGHFPPHRDLDPYSFRVIVPCFNVSNDEVAFLLDEQKIFLEPGWAYYINTRKSHSLFSFCDRATYVVLNVPAQARNCKRVIEALAIV